LSENFAIILLRYLIPEILDDNQSPDFSAVIQFEKRLILSGVQTLYKGF